MILLILWVIANIPYQIAKIEKGKEFANGLAAELQQEKGQREQAEREREQAEAKCKALEAQLQAVLQGKIPLTMLATS